MTSATYEFLGVVFDDFSKNEDGSVWSQMCNDCVNEHKIPSDYLDGDGQGICGVIGCDRKSDHYIDFK